MQKMRGNYAYSDTRHHKHARRSSQAPIADKTLYFRRCAHLRIFTMTLSFLASALPDGAMAA